MADDLTVIVLDDLLADHEAHADLLKVFLLLALPSTKKFQESL